MPQRGMRKPAVAAHVSPPKFPPACRRRSGLIIVRPHNPESHLDTRDDHLRLLRRGVFPIEIEQTQLTPGERQLLERCGFWLEALAKGNLSPISPDQRRFIAVADGLVVALSEHERAWVKLQALVKLHEAPRTAPQPPPLSAEDESVLRQLRGMLTRREIISTFANRLLCQWEETGRVTSKQLASARKIIIRARGRNSLPRTVGGGGRKPGSHSSNW